MGLTSKMLLLGAVVILAVLMWLYSKQDQLVFPSPKYRDNYDTLLLPRAVPLEYSIACGKQKSWYIPPRSADDPTSVPACLWVMFGGNASVALSWKKVVEFSPDPDAGFLLFDYPGYGFCEGKPSVDAIAESSDALVKALAAYLGIASEDLLRRPVRVMGHSLGSGMALNFATRHKTDRIILVAPFTSMRAMASRVVTPVFSWILRHHWDSMAALQKISMQQPPPAITVIHGSADNIVPVEMGRAMKHRFPGLIDYIEIPGGDHGNVLSGVWKYTAPDLEPAAE